MTVRRRSSTDRSSTAQPRRRRPDPALVVAVVALLAAAAPPAYAAIARNSVGSAQIVDGSIRTADLRAGSVTTSKISDGTVGVKDLGPKASPPVAGSFSAEIGYVVGLAQYPAMTTLGSLSADGTGKLVVRTRSRVLVDGQVYAQADGSTSSVICELKVGDTTLSPDSRAIVGTGASGGESMAVSGSLDVPPGTYDVSVGCGRGASASAGIVHVNAVAYPLP